MNDSSITEDVFMIMKSTNASPSPLWHVDSLYDIICHEKNKQLPAVFETKLQIPYNVQSNNIWLALSLEPWLLSCSVTCAQKVLQGPFKYSKSKRTKASMQCTQVPTTL